MELIIFSKPARRLPPPRSVTTRSGVQRSAQGSPRPGPLSSGPAPAVPVGSRLEPSPPASLSVQPPPAAWLPASAMRSLCGGSAVQDVSSVFLVCCHIRICTPLPRRSSRSRTRLSCVVCWFSTVDRAPHGSSVPAPQGRGRRDFWSVAHAAAAGYGAPRAPLSRSGAHALHAWGAGSRLGPAARLASLPVCLGVPLCGVGATPAAAVGSVVSARPLHPWKLSSSPWLTGGPVLCYVAVKGF